VVTPEVPLVPPLNPIVPTVPVTPAGPNPPTGSLLSDVSLALARPALNFDPGAVALELDPAGGAGLPPAGLLSSLNLLLIGSSTPYAYLLDPGNGDDRSADLVLTLTVDDPTPAVGDTITFTITVTDTGPDAATGVTVQELLPDGLTFVNATASQGSYNPETGVWKVGTVDTSGPRTLTITATVNSASVIANTATITNSDVFDADLTNNYATVRVEPRVRELALTGTVDSPDVDDGDVISWALTLTDDLPSDTNRLAVNDLVHCNAMEESWTPLSFAMTRVHHSACSSDRGPGGSRAPRVASSLCGGNDRH
jgi:uncharacterized repeat protein (TIGR01451 family)